jgi:hypothetical protein
VRTKGQWGVGEKKRDTFPVPHTGNGAKAQNGGPQLLVLYWRAGEIHMVKDNGSDD